MKKAKILAAAGLTFYSLFTSWWHPVLAEEAETYTITIEYLEADTSIALAPEYKAVLAPGDTYSQASPDIAGYVLADSSQAVISGTAAADTSIVVTYNPAEAEYKIHHWFQNNDGLYVEDETALQTLTAPRNSAVTATPLVRTGYTCVTTDLEIFIPSDGEMEKNLYYDLVNPQVSIFFETDGGSYVEPITADPGADITALKSSIDNSPPEKQGYTFGGWKDENDASASIPTVMPDANVTLTAEWVPGTVSYTVVYRFKNYYSSRFYKDGSVRDPHEYYDYQTVEKSGTTGSVITYDWASEDSALKEEIRNAYYEYEKCDTGVTIAGDGSTVEYVYFQPVKIKVYTYAFWNLRTDLDEYGNHTGTYSQYDTRLWGNPQIMRLGDYLDLPSLQEVFDQTITVGGKEITYWDAFFYNHSPGYTDEDFVNKQENWKRWWKYLNYMYDTPGDTSLIDPDPFLNATMLDPNVIPGDPSTYGHDPYVKLGYPDTYRDGSYEAGTTYDDAAGAYVVSITPYFDTREVYDYYLQFYHEDADGEVLDNSRVIEDEIDGNIVKKVYHPSSFYHYNSLNDVFRMHPMLTQGHMLEYCARIKSGVPYDPTGTPPDLTDENYSLWSANHPYDDSQPAEYNAYWLQHSTGRIYLELFYSKRTYPLTFLSGTTVLAETRPSDATAPADINKGGYRYQQHVDLNEAYKAISGNDTPTPPAELAALGYTFAGWYAEGDVSKTLITEPVVIDMRENRYCALWKGPEYTVSFDSQGGSAVASQTVENGKTASRPEDPVRDNCTFLGWYYKNTGVRYDFNRPVHADLELVAVWEAVTESVNYSVIHQLSDGTEISRENLSGRFDQYVSAKSLPKNLYSQLANTFPDALSKSMKLTSDGARNIIVFLYTPVRTYRYTVHYRDSGTNAEIAAPVSISDAAQILTAAAATIDGYVIDTGKNYKQYYGQGTGSEIVIHIDLFYKKVSSGDNKGSTINSGSALPDGRRPAVDTSVK